MSEISTIANVKRLQMVQLTILLELDRVCKKLGLSYCLAFGTSLGAIRHHGFIPWDDDVDVYMLAKDLSTLKQHADQFDNRYFLQHQDSDPGYGLLIARLRDSTTTLIENTEVDRDINHGVFVDIYPLYNAPNGGFKAKKLILWAMIYRLLTYGKAPVNHGPLIKAGSDLLLRVIPKRYRKALAKASYEKMSGYPYTGYVAPFYGNRIDLIYPEEWFFPARMVPFENYILPVQARAEEYLEMTYGHYMELPPEEKRVFHHDYACVDLDRPYTHYKGKVYCKDDSSKSLEDHAKVR